MPIDFLNLTKSLTKEITSNNRGEINDFIKQLEEKLNNMNEKKEYTVDRFEEDFAVCEDRATNEMINVNKSKLPENIKEGSILKFENGEFTINEENEKEIEQRIKEKMDNLWNN